MYSLRTLPHDDEKPGEIFLGLQNFTFPSALGWVVGGGVFVESSSACFDELKVHIVFQ